MGTVSLQMFHGRRSMRPGFRPAKQVDKRSDMRFL